MFEPIGAVEPVHHWPRKSVLTVQENKIEGGKFGARQIHFRCLANEVDRIEADAVVRSVVVD